ncbi:MAG: hypothetical protein MHM6MM_001485 [Cercozoa sp. M6MM]
MQTLTFDDDASQGARPQRRKQKKGQKKPKQQKTVTQKRVEASVQKYRRFEHKGKKELLKGASEKRLRSKLMRQHKDDHEAADALAHAELLLPEESGYLEADAGERTHRFSQEQLAQHVDAATKQKMFDLQLTQFGPYKLRFSRSGRHVLLGGVKGHAASLDWRKFHVVQETMLHGDIVRDVTFLHNETMWAAAQRQFTYVYDKDGTELHCLQKMGKMWTLDFLPYHFLLTGIGQNGVLKYVDTSTGEMVSELKTKMGPCGVMRQNPWNAVTLCAHQNGVVSMWAPKVPTPLVRMLCHKGPVTHLAVDRGGRYLVTCGADLQMKIWDVRTYKCMQQYRMPTRVTALDISDRGVVAVSSKAKVEMWKDAFRTKQKAPYMTHNMPGRQTNDVRFCPYEDLLFVGHDQGVSSVVVPGSGEPNFDSLSANPYQNFKQRQEQEVRQLLDKLQPHMITLDPNVIGTYDASKRADVERHKKELEFERLVERSQNVKKKMRGRNTTSKRTRRKRAGIIDHERREREERTEKWHREALKKQLAKRNEKRKHSAKDALDRFHRR